jgi:hypothetical protein
MSYLSGAFDMSTQDQTRAIMVRHRHLIKNRELSMLSRAAASMGLPGEVAVSSDMNNRSHPNFREYDRSNVGLS